MNCANCHEPIPQSRFDRAGKQAKRVIYCSAKCCDAAHEANRKGKRVRIRRVTDRKPVSITVAEKRQPAPKIIRPRQIDPAVERVAAMVESGSVPMSSRPAYVRRILAKRDEQSKSYR